jgi:hypothetical protein
MATPAGISCLPLEFAYRVAAPTNLQAPQRAGHYEPPARKWPDDPGRDKKERCLAPLATGQSAALAPATARTLRQGNGPESSRLSVGRPRRACRTAEFHMRPVSKEAANSLFTLATILFDLANKKPGNAEPNARLPIGFSAMVGNRGWEANIRRPISKQVPNPCAPATYRGRRQFAMA